VALGVAEEGEAALPGIPPALGGRPQELERQMVAIRRAQETPVEEPAITP
jgi:hypothetical protein